YTITVIGVRFPKQKIRLLLVSVPGLQAPTLYFSYLSALIFFVNTSCGHRPLKVKNQALDL
ncbi:hypothetical protein GIB67_033674, partial [Kingdonia uniflora]